MVDRREVDLSGIPPGPTPITPDDVDAMRMVEPTLSDAERAWLNEKRRPNAWLLGLAVVAVIVSWLVYRRFQR
jgi:hypothetical protein